MMTPEETAARLLEAIGRAHEHLDSFSKTLRKDSSVTDVHSVVNVRNYNSGLCVEMYVDAELANGKALTWWIDLEWKSPTWVVTASLLRSDDAGQDVVRSSKPLVCPSTAAAADALSVTAAEITTWSDASDKGC